LPEIQNKETRQQPEAKLRQQNPMTTLLPDIHVREHGTRHSGGDGTSGWVWYSARLLLDHLLACPSEQQQQQQQRSLQACSILELGSGTGWLALHLARHGAAHVTATDRPGALPLLLQNVLMNQEKCRDAGPSLERISVHELEWGSDTDANMPIPGRWDLGVGTDLLYIVENHRPLVQTMLAHDCPRWILAWDERKPMEEQAFLALAGTMGLAMEEPPRELGINPESGGKVWMVRLKKQQ
jgi:SAM-dependent methyltransferase